MGLTIYYNFSLPSSVSAEEVQSLLARWRLFALGLDVGVVHPLRAVGPGDIIARGTVGEHGRPGEGDRRHEVPGFWAESKTIPFGILFPAYVGRGCKLEVAKCDFKFGSRGAP